MMANHHILVVEDDPVGRETLAAYLRKEGYKVSDVEDGDSMRRVFSQQTVDLILLDIRLPGIDGLQLLREIRHQSEVGVIMVTGKDDEVDRIVALEMGADDYVTKPFNVRELLARAKNLLRRTLSAREASEDENQKSFAGWTLDIPRRCLFAPDGSDVRLTRGEFELLCCFASRPGRVMTRDNLLDYVSHRDWAPSDRTVDVLVGRLRRKIEADPKAPRHIITVHGIGYVFADSRHIEPGPPEKSAARQGG
ncbi:response regulator [Rhodospirillum rubrum]|uniref:response regulator n=1 Tax=Rhodospirillum rubrum TaxID=1085 RepID=UPI001904F5D6|nr:response regulator [Rhodospirillum rubrum]